MSSSPDRVYLNPEIKKVFHALELIESYGRGIRRAKEALSRNGSPALVFGPLNDVDQLASVTMGIAGEYVGADARVKGAPLRRADETSVLHVGLQIHLMR